MAAFYHAKEVNMNQMEMFKNPEFGSIRVIEENGKYLFCGLDIAVSLGYSNPRDALSRHCRCVVKRDVPHPQNPDRKISMTFIPEGDVYRLIVHSKLPSAERFERWVFDEVLPSIRRHGAYITREKLWEVATSPEALMKLCSDLLAEREENAALREENAVLEGKAAFYDLFIDLKHRGCPPIRSLSSMTPTRRCEKKNYSPESVPARCASCWAAPPRWALAPTCRTAWWRSMIWTVPGGRETWPSAKAGSSARATRIPSSMCTAM